MDHAAQQPADGSRSCQPSPARLPQYPGYGAPAQHTQRQQRHAKAPATASYLSLCFAASNTGGAFQAGGARGPERPHKHVACSGWHLLKCQQGSAAKVANRVSTQCGTCWSTHGSCVALTCQAAHQCWPHDGHRDGGPVELSHHLLSEVLAHSVGVGEVPAGATHARRRLHATVLCESIQDGCLTSSDAVWCFSCYREQPAWLCRGKVAGLRRSKLGVISTARHSPHVQVHLCLQNESNKSQTAARSQKGPSFDTTLTQTAGC
jgi:hypothetical protein